MDKEREKELKIKAFSFAKDVTKEAAKGGHQKDSLSNVLQGVYATCLQLLKEIEKEVTE